MTDERRQTRRRVLKSVPAALLATGGIARGEGRLDGNRGTGGSLSGGANSAGSSRPGGGFQREAKLTARDAELFDELGRSVALTEDRVVVGAPSETNANGENAGAAYVFVRSDGSWSQETKLTADDGAEDDAFGTSVGAAGDRIVVGAGPAENDLGFQVGGAYVYRLSGGSWNREAKLTPAEVGSYDIQFGNSVDITDQRIVVGARYDEVGEEFRAGSVSVFERSGGSWDREAKLTAGDGDMRDRFGFDVATTGERVVAGAPRDEDPNGYMAGSAYVFARSGGSWSQEAKVAPTADGDPDDHFGYSVGIGGETVVVGSKNEENPGEFTSGSAYVFERPAGSWSQVATLTPTEWDADNWYELELAVGERRVVVGAPGDGTDGSAYVYERSGGEWEKGATLGASDGYTGSAFGAGVETDGDRVAVGDPFARDSNGEKTGSAYVFDAPSGPGGGTDIRQEAFDAATGPDGSLSRSDVLEVVSAYARGDTLDGVSFTRSDVLDLVNYYVTQS